VRYIIERLLRENPESDAIAVPLPASPSSEVDDLRQTATQDTLYEIFGMLQRRGMIRKARMTLYANQSPTYWESRMVADAYRKRTDPLGTIRVFVEIPRSVTDPMAPAIVKMDWALKMGGVWYTQTVDIADPLRMESNSGLKSIIPVIQAAHRTLDGIIRLDSANHMFKKQKKRSMNDKLVLNGLRLV